MRITHCCFVSSFAGHSVAAFGATAGPVCRTEHDHGNAADSRDDRNHNQVELRWENQILHYAREECFHLIYLVNVYGNDYLTHMNIIKHLKNRVHCAVYTRMRVTRRIFF